ncbi:Delta(7)-sterol 5(6)-desaturase [Malassezia obtusa]|uniref:Delta(7)-sterol 5(6)-desaturase n=1 Tax=Malassezia obtusa TaxID=76774 RepID=A0AAF0IQT4_9BASI|nr:Delta(7)-sterol 5(6)-desaturase [Malassezia obtusa]
MAQGSMLNKTSHDLQQMVAQCGEPGKAVSWLPRDNIVRQTISLYVITYIGILLLYFSMASISYYFLFNKELMKHPRFLKNQIKLEIQSSLRAFPWLDLLTVPCVPFFLVFTDAYMITGTGLERIINGPAHHTLHHLYFTEYRPDTSTYAARKNKGE